MNGGNSLSERYQHESIEKKWQERWESDALFRTSSDNKKKWYALTISLAGRALQQIQLKVRSRAELPLPVTVLLV